MKRLIRKAGQTFFYGTSLENLLNISKNNILNANKLLVTTTIEHAFEVVDDLDTETIVALEIGVGESDIFFQYDIETWQENKKAKIDGTFTEQNFGMVYFKDTKTGLNYEAPYVGWENYYEEFKDMVATNS